jgi:dTDP-4-amino-4,6-dideoxygalactose transaminase/CelD/BcsL family acetyltransferase involved in cellulose biosynthesis
MEIEILDSPNGINELTAEWDNLLYKSGVIPVYLTSSWVSNWLRYLGKKHKTFIFTVWAGGNPVSIFPLATKKSFFLKKLEFIGGDEGDYLDFAFDINHKEECTEAFLSFLKEKKKDWDVCDLKDFSEESQHYEIFDGFIKRYEWKTTLLNTWKCPYLKIDGDWDGFLKRHGRKFQYNIKRERKQLEGLGKVVFKKVETQEGLKRYLPEIFEVHKRRWNGFYISSKFSQPEGQKFYSGIAKDYLAKEMLRLDLLLLNEKVIAFSYSFQWSGRYFYYTPGYDPDYAKYSPGTILLMHILEDAFKSGIKEFDFSKGELRYKSHWTTGERQNRRIIFASPTLKGKITYHIYLLYLRIFSHVRKLKSLRIIVGKSQQLRSVLKDKTTYISPDAIVSPTEIFKSVRSKIKSVGYFSNNPIFLKNGRTALFHGLKTCGFTTDEIVLVPAYVCGSIINGVKAGGLKVQFYKIKENLEPDFDDLELKSKDARALLTIHYFGFPQPLDKILRFCEEKGLLLIEDCAHSLFSKYDEKPLGTFGTFSIFSLTKTCPLPDGGMLLLNNGKTVEAKEGKANYPILSTLSLLEKWVEFKTGFSPRCYLLRNESLRNAYIKEDAKREIILNDRISTISLGLFRMIKEEQITEKRRNNYQYYLERLDGQKKIKIFFRELPQGVCPVGFPILIEERDRVRKDLLKKKINLRTFWDILPEEVSPSEHPIAYELSNKILILPVHQSLGETHLNYTIQNLLSVIYR